MDKTAKNKEHRQGASHPERLGAHKALIISMAMRGVDVSRYVAYQQLARMAAALPPQPVPDETQLFRSVDGRRTYQLGEYSVAGQTTGYQPETSAQPTANTPDDFAVWQAEMDKDVTDQMEAQFALDGAETYQEPQYLKEQPQAVEAKGDAEQVKSIAASRQLVDAAIARGAEGTN